MVDLSILTDEDLKAMGEEFSKILDELTEQHEEIQAQADAMSDEILYSHLRNIIDNCRGVLWNYQDDYILEQAVKEKLIQVLEERIPDIKDYVDYELLTDEQSKDYIFAQTDPQPFVLEGEHYVAFEAYGQGETVYCINKVNKEECAYLKKYADLNFLAN